VERPIAEAVIEHSPMESPLPPVGDSYIGETLLVASPKRIRSLPRYPQPIAD